MASKGQDIVGGDLVYNRFSMSIEQLAIPDGHCPLQRGAMNKRITPDSDSPQRFPSKTWNIFTYMCGFSISPLNINSPRRCASCVFFSLPRVHGCCTAFTHHTGCQVYGVSSHAIARVSVCTCDLHKSIIYTRIRKQSTCVRTSMHEHRAVCF